MHVSFISTGLLQNAHQDELPDCLIMESEARRVDGALLCSDCHRNSAAVETRCFIGAARKSLQLKPLLGGSSAKDRDD